MESMEEVRQYYNSTVLDEWKRIENRPEFLVTAKYIDRYIKPGDRVLDIGGGPGRYSIYLAEKGCDVTLFDLAEENLKFAAQKAAEANVTIQTVCGDARSADSLMTGKYDHVLLMGPLYHLLDECDRTAAVSAALRLLRVGGTLFASFISIYGGLVYMTKLMPEIILSPVQADVDFLHTLINHTDFAGNAFTKAFFITPENVLPFMERFPLEKLHLLGQEGVMTLTEDKIMAQPPEVIAAMVDFSVQVSERPDLLSWSEHLLYIGRKTEDNASHT